MLIFLLILIFIILFPIKLKLSILFIDNKLKIFVYKFKIYPKKKKKIVKHTELKNNPINNAKSSQKTFEEEKKSRKKIEVNIKNLISSLMNNKIKPKLKLELLIDYSLGDAAHTAQIFGIINTLIYLNFEVLNLFIKLKTPKISITPIFNSELLVNTKINSILYINLAQIIYIAILVLKNIKRKGGVPLRETYGK